MDGSVAAALDPWDNFYLIIGGAAAALTGLQFVVMTLIDSARRSANVPASTDTVSAFGTPTVVHFGATLLIAAIGTAPWESLHAVRLSLVVVGGAGLVYALIVLLRARRQRNYTPVLEDWLFHAILPVLAYAAVVIFGAKMEADPGDGLFVVNGMAMLLLFIGIHNAWDTVTYITVGGGPGSSTSPAAPKPAGRRHGRRR